jgi:hypothetical protein
MRNVRSVRDAGEGSDVLFNEADALRAENQQLYRLILQLVSDLEGLEDALVVAEQRPSP